MLLLSQTKDKLPHFLRLLGIYSASNCNTICKQRVGCNKDHACFEHLQVFSVNSYTLIIGNLDETSKRRLKRLHVYASDEHNGCFASKKHFQSLKQIFFIGMAKIRQ